MAALNVLFLGFAGLLFCMETRAVESSEGEKLTLFVLGLLIVYDLLISICWGVYSMLTIRSMVSRSLNEERIGNDREGHDITLNSNQKGKNLGTTVTPEPHMPSARESAFSLISSLKMAVVVDVGEVNCRFGFAGDETPNRVSDCHTILTNHKTNKWGLSASAIGVGTASSSKVHQAAANPSGNIPVIREHIKNGEISDWESLERIWHNLYEGGGVEAKSRSGSKVDATEHPVLISWSPSFTSKDAEKATEIFFENDAFHVPALYLGLSPVLALYASGRTTGCSVHSGESFTHTVAVNEGFALAGSLIRTAVAGKSVTDYFANLVTSAARRSNTTDNNQFLSSALSSAAPFAQKFNPYSAQNTTFMRLEKSRYCQCSLTRHRDARDVPHAFASYSEMGHDLPYNISGIDDKSLGLPLTLPDGTIINLPGDDSQFACAEVLFRSTVKTAFTLEPSNSIQATIEKCISSVETNFQPTLWSNVVVSGGNTNLRGFSQRLAGELGSMTREGFSGSRDTIISVHDTDDVAADRADAAWLGGSVLASSDSFHGNWITRAEYLEQGASLIHQRCQTNMR